LAKEIEITNLPHHPDVVFFMAELMKYSYILAGGTSRRLGTDKLFIKIENKTIIERIIEICRSRFKTVKIAGGDTDKLAHLNIDIIPDYPLARGPMAGIISALNDCPENHCFVTAADLIDLDGSIIDSLLKNYGNEQFFGLMETDGIQPLCGIYHKSALSVILKSAEKGDFQIRNVFHKLNHSSVPIPSNRWRNINKPEDLEELKLS
jgi:molybdopterin-guanine dinucleotide biosynthesis protein A